MAIRGGFYSNGGIQIQASGMANDTITIPGFEKGFTMSGLSSYTGNDSKGSVLKDGDSLDSLYLQLKMLKKF